MKRFWPWSVWMMGLGLGILGQWDAFGAAPAGSFRLPSTPSPGQPDGEGKPAAFTELGPTARLELFYAFAKTPVLRISYPWKEYSRASVEVRFFSLTEVDDERIQPLFFRTRYWNGKLLQRGYECLLRASDVPVEESFSSDGLQWHLVADRFVLGRPGLYVVREIPADPRLRTKSAIAVIYPLLEHWAADETHLCLELPGRYYPQPGQLRVWFLRDNRIVWTQKLGWPGMKGVLGTPASKTQEKPSPASRPEEKLPANAVPAEKAVP